MRLQPKTSTRWQARGAHAVVVGALLAMLPRPAAAQDARVRSAFERGARAMRAGRSLDAEDAFREATRLAPTMSEAFLDLGLVLGREGKMDDAVASLRQALTLDPAAPSGHMFLGIFLYGNNQPEPARRELQQDLALHPDNPECLMWLGTVDLALNHPEHAATSLDRAAELAPDDLNILELRGRAHSLVAKESYSRMATLQPGNWHVHRVQAQLYADEGKHAEAIVEFQAAVKLQPGNPDLYQALGDEYRAISQLEAAQKAYRQGLALAPANPVALYNLGSVNIENGDNAAGVDLLRAMVKVYPGSPVAQYYLGRGLANLGKDDEAVRWLQNSAATTNGEVSKRSFYELARLYRKLHRASEAEAALAAYNRLRLAEERHASQQAQDWKKLDESGRAPATP